MCGILGILADPSAEPPPDALGAVELLRHRGPDSEGRYLDGPLAMAMRRLAIIDLETGDQPVANEDGSIVCVANGEIYNYVELRAELAARGHVFSTAGDVEVIPHLYEELGAGLFERLRGMFAVALWDRRRRLLLLARDRYGIKPLYVGCARRGRVFASEVAAVLALGAEASVDRQAVADYLALGYVPGVETGLAGIRAVRPGHVVAWDDGGETERPYASEEVDRAAELESTLAEAVRLHLRSDVPLAVLLSGGLDSSLIASLAAEGAGAGLHTFSVGFSNALFDERAPARRVAEALGTEHHEVEIRPRLADDLPAIVRRLDEPNGDPSAVALHYVCAAAAEHVKVALAGEGGDEVFGGYARYAWDRRARLVGRALPAARLADLLQHVPGVRARGVRSGRKDVVRRALKLLRHAQLPDAQRYYSWFALLSDDTKRELVGGGLRPTWRVFADELAAAPAGLTPLGRLQHVDLRTMLAKDLLVKADRMSMAHSLELRVPMLDLRVVAAGLGLPDARKVRGVRTKVAIRELVARRLPPEIAARPKQGFEVPVDAWLRRELRPLAEELLAPERLSERGLVDPRAASVLLRRHLRGEADHGLALYGLVALELWLDAVATAARPPAAARR